VISVDVHTSLAEADRADVFALIDSVTRLRGDRPLSDQHWLNLTHGTKGESHALLAHADNHLVGYGQIMSGNQAWSVELVLDPTFDREHTEALTRTMITRALDVIAEAGGGTVYWWVVDPSAVIIDIALRAGLHHGRTLIQMRVPLPLDIPFELATRPFVVGADERAWLEVNNAAFAAHPEQGGWDLEALLQREQEEWFDPSGFLLHERDGQLAGFCWTKLHTRPLDAPDAPAALGEIYVIAAHPAFHGHGLGKALTIAGLASIAARGVHTGMLYVDRDNTTAVSMYSRLGFSVHHTEQAFVGTVAPSRQEGTR